MTKAKNKTAVPINYPVYMLFVFLLLIPLFFSTSLDNMHELPKAQAIIFLGGLFVLAASISLFLSGSKEFVWIEKQIDIPVAVFLLAAVISTLFSINKYVSYTGQYDRQLGLITYIYAILIYYFVSLVLNDKRKRWFTSEAIQLAGLLVAAYGIMQLVHADPFGMPVRNLRVNSTFGNANFASGFLVIVFPFMLSSALYKDKFYYRLIAVLITLAALVFMQTRIAYAAVIVQFLLMFVLFSIRSNPGKFNGRQIAFRALLILIGFGVVIAAVVLIAPESVIAKRISSISHIIDNPRWLLWRDSLKLFIMYPVTGSGISTFSVAFEKVITPELRLTEVRSIFDNAHNNYIQVLSTMGLIGGAAYLFLLIKSMVSGFRKYFNSAASDSDSILLLGCIGSITGYAVFGFADFDDPVMLLYLFAVLALLRSCMNFEDSKSTIKQKLNNAWKKFAIGLTAVLAIYAIYNVYNSVNVLNADKMFKQAKLHYMTGNIVSSIQYLNKAVTANPECADYRQTLATYTYYYCLQNAQMSAAEKNKLLLQAEDEIKKAEIYAQSPLSCKSTLALLLYEQGRKDEAAKLTDEILKQDVTSVLFRNNLARYFYVNKQPDKMLEHLRSLELYDPLNVDSHVTYMMYYFDSKDYANAKVNAEFVLKYDPQNRIASQVLGQIKQQQK